MREHVEHRQLALPVRSEVGNVLGHGSRDVEHATVLQHRHCQRDDRLARREDREPRLRGDGDGSDAFGLPKPARDTDGDREHLAPFVANDELASGETPFRLLTAKHLSDAFEHHHSPSSSVIMPSVEAPAAFAPSSAATTRP